MQALTRQVVGSVPVALRPSAPAGRGTRVVATFLLAAALCAAALAGPVLRPLEATGVAGTEAGELR